jgi:hypothetical protein
MATKVLSRLRVVSRALTVPLILAAVPAFLLFSQGQVKESVDQFFSDCLFVIEKQNSSPGIVLVTANIHGQPPKMLPLVFEGRDAIVNSILLDDPTRGGVDDAGIDLAFHPLTGTTCPGQLCEDAGKSTDLPLMAINLADLHKEFVYRFRVRLSVSPGSPKATRDNLKVFALFSKGADRVCRVQAKHWSNFWVWASALQKIALFAAAIVVGTFLLRWSSPQGKNP